MKENKNPKKINKDLYSNFTNFTVIQDSYFPMQNISKSENLIEESNPKRENKNIIIIDNFKSALFMLLANSLFVVVNFIGKIIGYYYTEVNINTTNFIRGIIMILVSHLYFLCAKIDIKKEIFEGKTKFKIFILLVRSFCGTTCHILLFLSLTQMRISSAMTIFNLMPVCVIVLGWILSDGEPSKFDISALGICLISVCLITKPGFIFGNFIEDKGEDSMLGLIYVSAAVIVNSLGVYLLKPISKDFKFFVSPYIMGYLYVIECGLLVSFSDNGFESLGIFPLFLSVVMALFFIGSVNAFIHSMNIGEPVKVLPITYIVVVWTLFLNVFVFKQGFDIFDAIGSIAIIVINVYITVTMKK